MRTNEDMAIEALNATEPIPNITHLIPLTISSLGVTLHVDRDAGEFYLDAEIEHCSVARASLLEYARRHNFVLDDPYYDEQQADGRLRSYLLEVETA